jgi:hypothetical protein
VPNGHYHSDLLFHVICACVFFSPFGYLYKSDIYRGLPQYIAALDLPPKKGLFFYIILDDKKKKKEKKEAYKAITIHEKVNISSSQTKSEK